MSIYKDDRKTKDGRQYFFQVMKNGNLYKSKRYLTREEARKEEAKYLLKTTNPSKKKFSVVADTFFDEIKETRKLSTYQTYIDTYRKHILAYFSDYDINSINIPVLKNFRENALKMGLSIRYLNKINNVLNLILDYASVNYGIVNYNRLLGRYQEKKDKIVKEKLRYITYDEYKKLISVIDDLEFKTFIMLLYLTGVRLGEALALTFEDLKDDTIIVNKTLYTKIKGSYSITSTKTNTSRVIKIDHSLQEQLQIYVKHMQSYTDYSSKWFLFGGVRYLAPTTINRKKHHYFVLSGVREITIHEFRHSHVSMLVNEYLKQGGKDYSAFLTKLSTRLGHSISVMERTYLHLFPSNQDEIVNMLNNM